MRLVFVIHTMLNDDILLNSSHLNTELALKKGKLYFSAKLLKYDWYLLLTYNNCICSEHPCIHLNINFYAHYYNLSYNIK